MKFSGRTTLLAVIGILVWYPAVFGQQAQTKPVARLVGHYVVTKRAVTPASTSPSLAEVTEIERRAFEQTNQLRVQHGLPPFEWDADVCRMARGHSQNMSRLNFFGHVGPDGLRLRDRARAVGILSYKVMAENIAYNQGYEDPGAFAVERWMASAKHRANILSREFSAMAIGMYIAPDGSVFLTQTFISR